MTKRKRLIIMWGCIALLAGGALFLAGFFTGKESFPERELLMGVENQELPGQTDFVRTLTAKDGWDIDQLIVVLHTAEPVEKPDDLSEFADVSLMLRYPDRGVSFWHTRIWYTADGAVAEFDEDRYASLTELDAEYIQGLMEEE